MPYCLANVLAEPFSVAGLANLTVNINQSCHADFVGPNILNARLTSNLTTGVNDVFWWLGPWMPYPFSTITSRLIDFKLPLLVLIFQLALPPLGAWAQVFSFFHLVANPADSVGSYFYALSLCFGLLKKVQREMKRVHGNAHKHRQIEEGCKELTLVLVAYATIGKPQYNIPRMVHLQASSPRAFGKAAKSLATDRYTGFIPVGAALLGFVFAVLFKYVYIDHNEYDDSNPQHVQIWSLSSSMTVVWAIPAVYLSSIIGVQRTRHSTGRILDQLEEDVGRHSLTMKLQLRLNEGEIAATDISIKLQQLENKEATIAESMILLESYHGDENSAAQLKRQWDNGALSNFRPDRYWRPEPMKYGVEVRSPLILDLMALAIVSTGSLGGVWLAARVPPEGMNCRTGVKLIMFAHYLLSAIVQHIINRLPISTWPKVSLTAVLDSLVFLSFANVILTTQVGILNRLGCYVKEISRGVWGVVLPKFTWEPVRKRLQLEYPLILFGFLVLQFVICVCVWRGYKQAGAVYRLSDAPSVDEGKPSVRETDGQPNTAVGVEETENTESKALIDNVDERGGLVISVEAISDRVPSDEVCPRR
ncbi:hypothetical protein B0H66DRAFT_589343 [Apodospora peruviana]|uniref:Uncharacterized protein n=1 Tax=Apodospora peruviana TaxID=516989 RepID=A0AAE0IKI9_9PEZI|nr:hypothetical protein B0H66DRAFT_589343 [Apodospora peruviana]